MNPWTWTARRPGLAWLALLWLCLLVPSPARAQSIESVLSPGPLAQAHARWQDDCKQCHIKFDRAAQDRLCVACHEKVGQDLRAKAGFHGRIKPQACRSCHTDHKGREARIAAFDMPRFDHAKTDFALHGQHRSTPCSACHAPAKKFRDAPLQCDACHRKDDVHKGSLGPQCATCHAESDWKPSRFDHHKTRFPLIGKHLATPCADCHRDKNYRQTSSTCNACHQRDDERKGHKGRFGEKCETCHSSTQWKTTHFNHDTDTAYPLRGQHSTASCVACHTGKLYQAKPSTECLACHKQDDKHQAALGPGCGSCHSERSWKERAQFGTGAPTFRLPAAGKMLAFSHAETGFTLLGKHDKVGCAECHKTPNYQQTPKTCYACHRTDDGHEGQEGRLCSRCHDPAGWTWRPAPKFDHRTMSRFPLLGKHAQLECSQCHATTRFKHAKSDCNSCHAKDDKHQKTLGTACQTCHDASGWKLPNFDHGRQTRFILDLPHSRLACSTCHTKPSEVRSLPVAQCVSCHVKDDVHRGSRGWQCQQCHETASFRVLKPPRGAK